MRVQGSRRVVCVPGQPGQLVSFSEEAHTIIVYENGAVIRLWARLERGQIVVITNRKSDQEMLCRVTYVKHFLSAKSCAEIEFTRPMNGFWGDYVPQGVLKSPGAAQTLLATPRRPAQGQPVTPTPTCVSDGISTSAPDSIPAAAADCPQVLSVSSSPAAYASHPIIVQSPVSASPLSPTEERSKAEPIEEQVRAYPAIPSAHFPSRTMVLVGAAAVALFVTGAIGNFILHDGAARLITSSRTKPMPLASSGSTEANKAQSALSARDPAPVVSHATIDVKRAEGLLGREARDPANSVGASHPTSQLPTKEPAWASKNTLLAPSPQLPAARIGGDAPPTVGNDREVGSPASPALIIEGAKLESFQLPVEPSNAASLAVTPAIDPLIKSTNISGPDFVLDRTFKAHSGWVTGVAFSSDGQRLASGGWDQTVKFWDVPTGQLLSTVGSKMKEVQALAFSRDGHWLAAENSIDTVTLWDARTSREIRTLSSSKPLGALGTSWVYSIAFSPDGRWLASGVDDKTVRLWDVATGHAVRDLTSLRRSVIYAAFSPDGRWLASGDDDKSIRIWDVSTGQEIRRLSGHKKPIYAVAFSPNGYWLASASADKTIKLWDINAGREIRTLTGHGNLVTSLAFSPDGRWLASGSWDKTVKIWNVETGHEVQTLSGHDHSIYTVAFDSRGQWLASGSEDGTIKLWRLSGVGDQTRLR